MTTKVHQCHDHLLTYFDTTGESLYMADCSYTESSHGRLRRLEETHNTKTESNLGTDRHLYKNTSGVVRFAFKNLGEGNLTMPDNVYNPGGDDGGGGVDLLEDGESRVWAAGDTLGKRKRDEEEVFRPPKVKRTEEINNNSLNLAEDVENMFISGEEEVGTDGTEVQHSVSGKITYIFISSNIPNICTLL